MKYDVSRVDKTERFNNLGVMEKGDGLRKYRWQVALRMVKGTEE